MLQKLHGYSAHDVNFKTDRHTRGLFGYPLNLFERRGDPSSELTYDEWCEKLAAAGTNMVRIRLTGRVLSRVTVSDDGKLAYTWVSQTDFKETNSRPVDTEDLVNECLRIEGTRGAFIAIEQMNQRIKVSFRSRTDLNVAKVAEEFGGGGHKQAAGAVLPGPLEVARDRVKSAMLAALAE